MEVNLNGILFRAFSYGVVMVLLGLMLLVFGGKKHRKTAILTVCFFMCFSGYYLWIYKNPEIVACTGRFESAYWYRRVAPHTKAYVFDIKKTGKERLYLDTRTKKEIIPFELTEGAMYRIQYENRTNIVVAIEEALN